jgi:hypothetical protein
MPDEIGVMWNVRKLLREGRVQEADDLITKDFSKQGLVEDKADAVAPQEVPRTQTEVLHDILEEITMRFGNPQDLVDLLDEMHAVAP